MIQIENLEFAYPGGAFRLAVPELLVSAGSTLAVIGPSGGGKTTLLHLIAGIVVPDAGRIVIGGTELTTLEDARRRDLRIAGAGLVFQEFELLDHLHVLDNILLPYRITGVLELNASVRDRAAALAEQVGIGDKLRRSVRRLSQGERQRVGVCRALVHEPPLVLADEPTGNLDPGTRDRVLQILLDDAASRQATLVTVLHDHELLPKFQRVVDITGWGAS